MKYYFYVGSFENELSVCSIDTETLQMEKIGGIPHEFRPAQLSMNHDMTVLYTANENSDGPGGVSSYSLSEPLQPMLTGDIKPGNHGPAYAALTKDGKYLIGASFFDGVAELFRVDKTGAVKELIDSYQFETTGTACNDGTFGQGTPRCHCVYPLKNSNLIAITDYSGDRLTTFAIENEKLVLKTEYQFERGEATRFITDCPFRDDLYYVLAEYGSKVHVMQIDEIGNMKELCCESTLEEEKKQNSTAAIKTTKDGKYLYVTNRGYDNIAVFEITNNGEKIERIGFVRTGVGYSRDFSFTPDEEYMLVASMFEGKIYLHKMNHRTGMPEPMGISMDIPVPTNIVFAKI